MPRQFMNRGDKLVFSNGILGLTVASVIVLVAFGGQTHRLIPLYAVGVFTSFTLSQLGMVIHWFRLRTPGWQRRSLMNGVGAVMTGVVTFVVLVTKFTHGAYLVIIAVAALMAVFYVVRRHYDRIAYFLEPQNLPNSSGSGRVAISRPRTTVVLFVSKVNELTARSLALGRGLSPDDFHAVTIASDPEQVMSLQRTWQDMDIRRPSGRRGLAVSRVHQAGGGVYAVTEPGPTTRSPSSFPSSWWSIGGRTSSTTRTRSGSKARFSECPGWWSSVSRSTSAPVGADGRETPLD